MDKRIFRQEFKCEFLDVKTGSVRIAAHAMLHNIFS